MKIDVEPSVEQCETMLVTGPKVNGKWPEKRCPMGAEFAVDGEHFCVEHLIDYLQVIV